ncbi:MAG: flavin reductase [Proteobacteria bacterium]|nr:flavin reductase [Pseudomonadota bacterium]
MFGFGKKKRTDFVDVPLRDNFYQTSSFFPMPVVLVSTVSPSGQTNLGTYSLCFPHVIAGSPAMMLISRSDSNTATNIRRTGLAALNFIPDEKKLIDNCVEMGFPGDTTEEKMARSIFTLLPSRRQAEGDETLPEIVAESVQVFECRWDASHPWEVSEAESHFLLRIENIDMQEHWFDALESGKAFPKLPVDFGFRQGVHFWFAHPGKPYAVDVPARHGVQAEHVQFQAERIDPDLSWDLEACARLTGIPRIFMDRVLRKIAAQAKERGATTVTVELLDQLPRR